MGDIEPASFAFVLFFLYCILASIALFQILRIICYGIPINLQFSTFSLLILFYAHIYYKTEKTWEERKLLFTAIFVIVNLTYLVVTIVSVALVATEGQQGEWENELWSIVSAVGFFTLVFVLAYYGLHVASLMRAGRAQISFQPKNSSNVQVIAVTIVIFLLFTTRAIFNVLSAVDVISFDVESGLELNDLGMFALFFVWEIVPTTLVIFLFWRIPNPRRQQPLTAQAPFLVSTLNEKDRLPAYSTDASRTSLFDNPQRYDSDEDGSNTYSVSPRFYLPSNSPYSPYDTNPTPPSYSSQYGAMASKVSVPVGGSELSSS